MKARHVHKEIFTALLHTINTLVHLVQDLLNKYQFSYAMLGELQIDNLETILGYCRILSGINYLVFVKGVMHSDKKVKVKSPLKFYTV